MTDWTSAILNTLDIAYIFLRLLYAQHHGDSLFHILIRRAIEIGLDLDLDI